MNFWSLLDPNVRTVLARQVLLASLAGLMSIAVVPIINYGVLNEPQPLIFGILAVISGFLLWASVRLELFANLAISRILEGRLRALRMELAERLAASPLRAVETVEEVRADIAQDLSDLDDASQSVGDGIHFVVQLIAVGAYVFYLSPSGFLLWAGFCFGLGGLLRPAVVSGATAMTGLQQQQVTFRGTLERVLAAFPQLRLDTAARESIRDDLSGSLRKLGQKRGEVSSGVRDVVVWGAGVLYVGIGIMLFAAPGLLEMEHAVTYQLVTALFVTISPATFILQELRTFMAADRAIISLNRYRGILSSPEAEASPPEPLEFQKLGLVEAGFRYGEGFAVGPMDLEIRRGEVVFITGANGSGKTTLMKLIAGLYPPTMGLLEVDGREIEEDDERYRALFTTIFSDQHLFPRLYGLEHADPDRVQALLHRFGLADVTTLNPDGFFSDLSLSSGQAKRLSMVIALLEDRPIYLLDEWAAHQDPQTRRAYYEVLIPELKARGRTVIVVSHDDRYFYVADRVLHLVNGRLQDAK